MNIDTCLRSIRPTGAAVDAELSPARRAQILTDVLTADRLPAGRITDHQEHAPLGRRTGHRLRRSAFLVAAALVVVALVAGLSSTLGGGLSPVSPQPAAAATIDRLADRAGIQPTDAVAGPSQFLAVVRVEQQSGRTAIRQDSYIATDGWTWRKDTEGRGGAYYLYHADAGLDLTALPDEPKQLEQMLRSQPLGTQSDDQGLFKIIGEIVRSEAASPAVRQVALQVLAEMSTRSPRTRPAPKGGETTPQVTASTGWIDQRPVDGVTFNDLSEPGRSITYWFDHETSVFVRETQTFPDGQTFSSQIEGRHVVDALPSELVRQLGTERVEKVVKF